MNAQVQADVHHAMRQASADATLIDRLHTAEAKVAILESQVARQTADADDAVDRFKRLGEQLALQGAELFALRQFKAGVPWEGITEALEYANDVSGYNDDIGVLFHGPELKTWLDANRPQEEQ